MLRTCFSAMADKAAAGRRNEIPANRVGVPVGAVVSAQFQAIARPATDLHPG